jgi:hypothetical protein
MDAAGGPPMGGDAPQKPPAAPITIPLAFLAQPDNEEQMQTPAKGDSGTMTVDYMVVDVQGDMAVVQPVSVNGNELGGGTNPEPDQDTDPDEQEGQDLRNMAGQMGAE